MNFTSSHWTLNRCSVLSILAFCLSFFILFLSFPKFSLPVQPQDEGILLIYPELILKGFMPNRDFATMYPPGNFWLLALAYSVFEPSVLVERSVGFLYILAIVLGVFFLSTRFRLSIAVISAVVSCIILKIFPTFGAFSWFGGVALALWSLVIAARASLSDNDGCRTVLSLASGVLSGAGILFRIDLVMVTVLSSITVLGFARKRNLHAYILGFAVALTPLIVHTFRASFGIVFDNLVLDVWRIGPGRNLPLNIKQPEVLIVFLTGILTFLIGLSSFIKNRNSGSRLLFGIGIFAIGLLPQAVQRADTWHLVYVGCITVPLFVSVISEAFGSRMIKLLNSAKGINCCPELQKKTPVFIKYALVFVVGSALTYWGVNALGRPLWWRMSQHITSAGESGRFVVSNGRVVPVKSDRVADTQSLIDEVHELATPGEALFVGPGDLSRTNYADSFLYFMFPELKPASYYLEMNPGSANRSGSRLATDIEKADIVILNKRYDSWDEKNKSKSTGALEPLRIVQSQFCFHSAIGTYVLLTRCGMSKK